MVNELETPMLTHSCFNFKNKSKYVIGEIEAKKSEARGKKRSLESNKLSKQM